MWETHSRKTYHHQYYHYHTKQMLIDIIIMLYPLYDPRVIHFNRRTTRLLAFSFYTINNQSTRVLVEWLLNISQSIPSFRGPRKSSALWLCNCSKYLPIAEGNIAMIQQFPASYLWYTLRRMIDFALTLPMVFVVPKYTVCYLTTMIIGCLCYIECELTQRLLCLYFLHVTQDSLVKNKQLKYVIKYDEPTL